MATHRALRGGGTVDDTSYVEPSAYVWGNASIGKRSYVGHGAYIGPLVVVGDDVIICDRLRVETNVADGTTLPCDCCEGGGGGGASVLEFDSVYLVGSLLSGYDTTGKTKGTLAYVGNDTFAGQGSVHDYYTLVYGENLTVNPGTSLDVVNSPTFGVDGAQWVRKGTPNEQALQKGFWAVDPDNASGNANDENNGWGTSLANARLRPLLTFAELNRRNAGRNGSAQVQIALMSDDTQTPIMNNFKGAVGDDQPCVVGDMIQIGADYTVSSYLTAIPASNLSFILNATGIGAAGNLGKLVTTAAQDKWAMITSVDGADGCTVTQPHNYNPIISAGPTTGVDFVAAETVRVWEMPLLTQWPFPGDVQYPTAWHCRIAGTTGDFDLTQLGSSSPQITACSIEGWLAEGSELASLIGCIFQTNDSTFYGPTDLQVTNSSTLLTDLYISGGTMLIHGTFNVQGSGSTLQTGPGAVIYVFNANVSAYNDTTPAIRAVSGSKVLFDATSGLYGNIDQRFIEVAVNATAQLTQALCFGLTIFGTDFGVANVGYHWADLPVSDPLAFSGIGTN